VVRAYLDEALRAVESSLPLSKPPPSPPSAGALLTAKWSSQYLQTSPGAFRQQYTLSSSLGLNLSHPATLPSFCLLPDPLFSQRYLALSRKRADSFRH
jgi:hypothetical protein